MEVLGYFLGGFTAGMTDLLVSGMWVVLILGNHYWKKTYFSKKSQNQEVSHTSSEHTKNKTQNPQNMCIGDSSDLFF